MPSKNMLMMGKIPGNLLERCVFPYLGTKSERVLRGAGIGEDSAVIDMDKRVLVLKTNPVTGATQNIGRIAVHINANDIATRGARPMWFLNTILLPDKTSESTLLEITRDIHQACTEINVHIVGGHTECSPGLTKPIVIGFMAGEADKRKLLPGKAKLGDSLIITRGAGIEGTGILAYDFEKQLKKHISHQILLKAKKFINQISIVDDALTAVDVGGIDALHTPTEGGVIQGIHEMAEISGLGIQVEVAKIPLTKETSEVCRVLNVDPFRLLSSGALLIAVRPRKTKAVLNALNRSYASVIGKFTELNEGRKLIGKDGGIEIISQVAQDEVYRLLTSATPDTCNAHNTRMIL